MTTPASPQPDPTAAKADLTSAKAVLDVASDVVAAATRALAAAGGPDVEQVLAYDLAHAAATVETGRAMLAYGEKGDVEARLTCAYVADLVAELAPKLFGREADWGVEAGALDEMRPLLAAFPAPAFLA